MAEYKVEVTTGDKENAGTFDYIYLTIIGTKGESEKKELDNSGIDFTAGKTGTYTVKSTEPLGDLLLVKVDKDPYFLRGENQWFCTKIVVTTPENDVILFPCHRWVSRGENVELRPAKAVKIFEEKHSQLIDHRKNELMLNRKLYKWGVFAPGLPHVNTYKNKFDLPEEQDIGQAKRDAMMSAYTTALAEVGLKGLLTSTEQWESLEAMKNIFWFYRTPISEHVQDHWMDDDFYGFQFLNAVNSNMIERCTKLPSNFPVTEEMVKPFLKEGTTLQKEIEDGNILIVNYKRMDGIPSKVENGVTLPFTPGICLFYLNPEKKVMPIAIQLYQKPSETNPIFLPSDPKPDWLLAKMFLRNVDLVQHLAVFHHMESHMLGEGFAMATLRQLPSAHPLYKLLTPHCRNNIYTNTGGRTDLMAPEGPFNTNAIGSKGMFKVMARALSETTYKTLCLPENIVIRGLEKVPDFYYRDDGLKLWDIINSFVKAMIENYYPSDEDVRKDTELQAWINEIFTHTFLGNEESGIPSRFDTVEEAIKFITMVIFRVTGQHATTNDGQVFIGDYPIQLFDEPAPKKIMEEFKAKLTELSEAINERNAELTVAYNYLNPAIVENSVNK
ncbi:hydroperoxide isomerase ALOXE3-like [Diretmus argenteus]